MAFMISHSKLHLIFNKNFLIFFPVQRSVYKDLVLILQRDAYLSLSQLKTKVSIWMDVLLIVSPFFTNPKMYMFKQTMVLEYGSLFLAALNCSFSGVSW